MFSHIFVGANDLTRAKSFYDALFGAIGGNPGMIDEAKNRLVYMHDGGMFMVAKPIDGQPATPANGGTIGFAIDGPAKIDAWHEAGVAAGGRTCEDPPGVRKADFGDMYLAYLRDPDGNKLCGLYMMSKG
jgi:catechol 2,3-dioxygenase-like lactoylglutathione lyase family enzyme